MFGNTDQGGVEPPQWRCQSWTLCESHATPKGQLYSSRIWYKYMLLLFVEGFLLVLLRIPNSLRKRRTRRGLRMAEVSLLGVLHSMGGASHRLHRVFLLWVRATRRNVCTWVDLTQKHVLFQNVVQWFVLLTDNILRLGRLKVYFTSLPSVVAPTPSSLEHPGLDAELVLPQFGGLGHDRARDRCHMMWLEYQVCSRRWSLLIDYTDFF